MSFTLPRPTPPAGLPCGGWRTHKGPARQTMHASRFAAKALRGPGALGVGEGWLSDAGATAPTEHANGSSRPDGTALQHRPHGPVDACRHGDPWGLRPPDATGWWTVGTRVTPVADRAPANRPGAARPPAHDSSDTPVSIWMAMTGRPGSGAALGRVSQAIGVQRGRRCDPRRYWLISSPAGSLASPPTSRRR